GPDPPPFAARVFALAAKPTGARARLPLEAGYQQTFLFLDIYTRRTTLTALRQVSLHRPTRCRSFQFRLRSMWGAPRTSWMLLPIHELPVNAVQGASPCRQRLFPDRLQSTIQKSTARPAPRFHPEYGRDPNRV